MASEVMTSVELYNSPHSSPGFQFIEYLNPGASGSKQQLLRQSGTGSGGGNLLDGVLGVEGSVSHNGTMTSMSPEMIEETQQ